MYVWFEEPVPVASKLGVAIESALTPYAEIVGFTHFGDLFLLNPSNREFGIYLQGCSMFSHTGFFERSEFDAEYLSAGPVIEDILRPADSAILASRLGELGVDEVYYPVPLPALGGSDDLGTYERGNVWVYVSFVCQTLGVQRDP